MSDIYLIPLRAAVTWFPLIALFFTIPYVIVQYRKYERIPMLKVLVTYSFIFYMLAAYFIVILPLPSIESVANSTVDTHMILQPLESFRDYIMKSNLSFSSKSEILLILRSPVMLQLAFNVLLVFPFGIYLRYYFRQNWWETLIWSLGLSLFYELTQLTGLYFIYPKPYRFFELDDLICNTVGGMLGYFTAPILYAFLPRRAVLDAKARRVEKQVSVVRRILAALTDFLIVSVMFLPARYVLERTLAIGVETFNQSVLVYMWTCFLYAFLCSVLSGGFTPGKRLFRLRVLSRSGAKANFFQHFARSFLLYCIIYSAPMLIIETLLRISDWPEKWQYVGGVVVVELVVILFLFAAETVLKLFGSDRAYRFDTLSRTECVSVVKKTRKRRKTREVAAPED